MYLLVQVHRHFKPEFLNRLSEVVIFEALSHCRLKEIVKIQMRSVIARVAAKSISLSASDAALDVILSESYNPVSMDSFRTNQMLFLYNHDFPVHCTFC
jgi:ATP-dependent Clp protease ATP-binding subunit ClpA